MKQLIPALFAVGAVMLLIGAAVYVTGWQLSPYIYTIGATFVALAQINSPSKCKSPTIKRLRRQQIFGALLLVLTGAFMFFTHGNEWIVSQLKHVIKRKDYSPKFGEYGQRSIFAMCFS